MANQYWGGILYMDELTDASRASVYTLVCVYAWGWDGTRASLLVGAVVEPTGSSAESTLASPLSTL